MFDEKKNSPGSESLHAEPSSVELGRNRDRPRPLRAKLGNYKNPPALAMRSQGDF